ncbi:MAG: hypothetical protein OXL68_10955 [Paracoccaceae bacterium]|nr:hypothetical protein [Paracoccaceae bacterium]
MRSRSAPSWLDPTMPRRCLLSVDRALRIGDDCLDAPVRMAPVHVLDLAGDGELSAAAIDGGSTRNDTRTITLQIEAAERRLDISLSEVKAAEARRDVALTTASVAEKRRQTADQTVERMTEAFTAAVSLIADGVAWPRDTPGEWLEGLRFPLERDRWHDFRSRYRSVIAWMVVWACASTLSGGGRGGRGTVGPGAAAGVTSRAVIQSAKWRNRVRRAQRPRRGRSGL